MARPSGLLPYETTTNRGGRIRTDDFLLPKQALYRTELRPADLCCNNLDDSAVPGHLAVCK
jgi:hypothetical protein